MKLKKTTEQNAGKKFNEKLEKSSKIFLQLGMVLALFLCYLFLEHKTQKSKIEIGGTIELNDNFDEMSPEPFQKQKITAVVKQQRSKKLIPQADEFIKGGEEDIITTEVNPELQLIETDTLSSEEFDIDKIVELDIPETIEHDVPIKFVEKAPIYPGCEGSEEMLRSCFEKKIKRHINRNFDAELGQELGLPSGRKQIHLMFTIDKNGTVSKIKVRAPHPRLKTEAERLARILPKMTPGIQGTQPVGVSYVVPIVFLVE